MVSCAGLLFRSGGELFRGARVTKQSGGHGARTAPERALWAVICTMAGVPPGYPGASPYDETRAQDHVALMWGRPRASSRSTAP